MNQLSIVLAVAASLLAACKKSDAPAGAPAAKATAPPPVATAPAPETPEMKASKEIVQLFKSATQIGLDTKGDCKAFATKIDPLRTQLWDIGKAHPSVLKSMTNDELHSIGAADALEALAPYLGACKDEAHAKEFAYAIGKVM